MSEKRELKTEKRRAKGRKTEGRRPETEGKDNSLQPADSSLGNVKRELTEISVAECIGTEVNPRGFDPKASEFLELLADVKINGVLMPVIARHNPDVPAYPWEVLAGRRRLEAAKAAGLSMIPALVYEGLTDAEAHKLTVKENIQRENLKPLEESKAVRLILADNGNDYKAAAAFFGRPERWVHLRAKLLDLSLKWQKEIADGNSFAFGWSAAHLELIARLDRETDGLLTTDSWGTPLYGIAELSAPTAGELDKWIHRKVLRPLRETDLIAHGDTESTEKRGESN